jgi:hypothetical protein
MPWYPRVQHAINSLLLPVLPPTQPTNLALLVSARLAKRALPVGARPGLSAAGARCAARARSEARSLAPPQAALALFGP